jgi:hypothetical protein
MTKILSIGCALAGAFIITGYMYNYKEPEQSIPVDEQTSIQLQACLIVLAAADTIHDSTCHEYQDVTEK